ncbi:MAG: hypothetical protein AAGA91_18300 [Pseudomonadota bacterium]
MFHDKHLGVLRRLWARFRAVRRPLGTALLMGFTLLWPAVASAVEQVSLDTRFARFVKSLQGASPDLQAQFALRALDELAAAYRAEAELARAEARSVDSDPGLIGWSLAVEQFSRQLPLVAEDIQRGFPVAFHLPKSQPPALRVADRTIILSHPRPDLQGVYEQAVLGEFCARQRCIDIEPVTPSAKPIPVSAGQVRPRWEFTELGPRCSLGGVHLKFDSEFDLAAARRFCTQLMQELSVLATELAWQLRHLVAIEWEELQLAANPGRTDHRLRLNAAGEAVLASLPLLYATPGLLAQVTPWLRSKLTEVDTVDVVLQSSQFDWVAP